MTGWSAASPNAPSGSTGTVGPGPTRGDAGPPLGGTGVAALVAQCSDGLMWYSNTRPPTAIRMITVEITMGQM